MPYDLVVCDFHGTLIDSTDEALNKRIGYTLLRDAKKQLKHGNPLAIFTLVKLLYAKILTEKALAEYHDGKKNLGEVYAPFNSALKGLSVDRINGIVDAFAKEIARDLDGRILVPLRGVRHDGKYTGILSLGYDYAIQKTLEDGGYDDVFPENIIAHTLEHRNGKAIGFTLDIYERKPAVLRNEFFINREFNSDRTLYLGDDPKDDEPIASMLPDGHFIVPFLATDDFKEHMASKHRAFVPESQQDLEEYLRSL